MNCPICGAKITVKGATTGKYGSGYLNVVLIANGEEELFDEEVDFYECPDCHRNIYIN